MTIQTSTIYDPIMNALLAYLKTATGFSTVNPTFRTMARGIFTWEQLIQNFQQGALRQPALFLYDGVGFGGGTITYGWSSPQRRAMPVLRTFARTVVIYANANAPGQLPGGSVGGKGLLPSGGGAIFHPLIEAIETALGTPDNPETGTLTLGGLVAYCRIEGRGMISPPDIDDNGQGMATIPLEIKVP